MRAIMIDDEPILLNHQKSIIDSVEGFNLINVYTNSSDALKEINETKPELIFLDVELMGENGIDVANKIAEKFPAIKIVFITSYSQYAVDAFEVNAIDYILKPLNKKRLMKTYSRVKAEKNSTTSLVEGVKIQVFSSLNFLDSENNKIPVKWRTIKAKELFLFLLHHRGKPVNKGIILNLLWPEGAGEKVYNQMYTAVYQVRSLLNSLKLEIQISNQEEYYILHLNDVKLDMQEWQKNLESFKEVTAENLNDYQEVMNLYQGEYLRDFPYTWLEAERERLRVLWYSHMVKIVEYFIKENIIEEGIQTLKKIQCQCPYAEEIYFMLMKLYAKVSDRIQVENEYTKLKVMLADQLGVTPDNEVENWYNFWKGVVV